MSEEIPKTCQACGKALELGGRSDKTTCTACTKERADVFYAYSQLRFEVWRFLKTHGPKRTREVLYNRIVAEEGVEWTISALGETLVKSINEGA